MIIPAFQHRPDESLVVANLKENKVEQYKILGAIALENTKLICQLAANEGGGKGCWSGAIRILQSLTEKSGRFYRDSTKKNPSSPLPPPPLVPLLSHDKQCLVPCAPAGPLLQRIW